MSLSFEQDVKVISDAVKDYLCKLSKKALRDFLDIQTDLVILSLYDEFSYQQKLKKLSSFPSGFSGKISGELSASVNTEAEGGATDANM